MGCDIHGYIEVDEYKKNLAWAEEQWNKDWERWIKPLGGNAITKQKWLDKIEHRWDAKINIGLLLSRNYDMFGFIFGVRRDRPEEQYGCPAIAPNRGIPENADGYPTKSEYTEMESDAHSASYITLKEIHDIDWSKPQGSIAQFVKDNGFAELIKVMEVFDDGSGENVRLVVWFDN